MLKLISVIVLSLVSVNSFAMKKSHTTEFFGARFQGFDQIGIKRLLRDDLSRRDLAIWDISSISVSAKSLDGSSLIKLVAGRGEVSEFKVPGKPENFESQSIGFSSHTFHIPSYALRDGAIKLVLVGDLKIDDVKVELKASPSYNFRDVEGVHFAEEATFRVGKIIGSSETVHVAGHIDGIRLTGVKEKVSVTSVTVVYADGERIELTELDGRLNPGQSVAFRIAHELERPVAKIIVGGVSSKLIGSRGSIKIELGTK